MLEIIALIFLTKHIAGIASAKGYQPGRWKLFTILAWVSGEFAGIIIGVLIFGTNNIFSVLVVGIMGAITGYLLLKSILNKKPNILQDDIENFGQQ